MKTAVLAAKIQKNFMKKRGQVSTFATLAELEFSERVSFVMKGEDSP